MSVFNQYARYYDLLYRDKDYASEALFVLTLIREHCFGARHILELGCGTGVHAQHLAESGACVHGVDRSTLMLEDAWVRHRSLPSEVAGRLVFSLGDAREVRLGKTFDAVISLFHVMSYQILNEEIVDVFATAKAHLKSGGVFIFDCWYGPGVLTDRPVTRVKRVGDDSISVTRIAEPTTRASENVVDVNYTIFVRDKASGATEELKELHRMRYFFSPEIQMFADHSGFKIIAVREWMKQTEPSMNSWNACFVARA